MNILESFNIPIMSDEGMQKTIEAYKIAYMKGKAIPCYDYDKPKQSTEYISNIVVLSGDKKPIKEDNSETDEEKKAYKVKVNKERYIAELYLWINAMKRDINEYGFWGYRNKIYSQVNESFREMLTANNIKEALNYNLNSLRDAIMNDKVTELPQLLNYFYSLISSNYNGNVKEIPYVAKSPNPVRGFRIQINNPTDMSGNEFYLLFISKLIELRIPYECKYNYNSIDYMKDTSVFYFPNEYLNDVINVLDEIGLENPMVVSKMGTPPIGHLQKSYYGLSHVGNHNVTYNNFFTSITTLAFFISFCNTFRFMGKYFHNIPQDDKNIVNRYANFFRDEELVNIIVNSGRTYSAFNSLIPVSIFDNIVKKYGEYVNNFNININDYRNNINKINSLYTYGDLNHMDVPCALSADMIDELNRGSGFQFN